jgi:hypothetical protein
MILNPIPVSDVSGQDPDQSSANNKNLIYDENKKGNFYNIASP